jgi:pSer/pThr/pTyr-binding forkhead associated (FHA) protein
MWKLVIEDDEGKRTVVPLTRDDYTIGRKEGNTIRLTERNVSREHARIAKKTASTAVVVDGQNQETQYVLEDAESYNGVYVNGLRVSQAQDLVNGDLVQIGDYRMVLQDDQAQAAQVIAPSIPADAVKTSVPSAAQNRGSLLMERPNRLVMLAGPTPGAEFPLDRERLTIGRAEDANISVNHNSVSRLHSEVHDLGEGRFEIVDKGSSNGVRVNSAELKRGIIEAGDVIELGDVKFKFVGAGQIFLPGINDTAQLSAIGDRVIDGTRRRRGTMLPFTILGAAIAAVVIVAAAWYLKHQQDPEAPIVGVVDDHDGQILARAKALCDNGDCDKAHTLLATDLPDTSPERTAPEFKDLERRWAEGMLTRAANEPDVNTRRNLLQQVATAVTVDPELRKAAADQLQALDQATPPGAASVPSGASSKVGVDAGSLGMTATSGSPRDNVVQPSNGSPVPATVTHPTSSSATNATAGYTGGTGGTGGATGSSTGSGGAVSTLDQARNVMLNDPLTAKSLLMPRLTSGHATRDELSTLKIICRDPRVGDRGCVEECNKYLVTAR